MGFNGQFALQKFPAAHVGIGSKTRSYRTARLAAASPWLVNRQLAIWLFAPEQAVDLLHEPVEIHRLGVEFVAAGSKSLFARA